MRGVAPVIAEVLLLGLTIAMVSSVFYYYQSTMDSSKEIVEKEGGRIYCDITSNFVVKDVAGNNITIWNNGGSELNLEYFGVYIENVPVNFTSDISILGPDNSTIFILDNIPTINSTIKVFGDCNTGDSILVK